VGRFLKMTLLWSGSASEPMIGMVLRMEWNING
jgi:hypothetical protein